MAYTCFNVEITDQVAHIVMSRPEKANSMIPEFWRELPQLMNDLDADGSVRCAVISAEGKHFTAGMDLASFNDINNLGKGAETGRARVALRALIGELQETFTSMERVRFPVLTAINGACIGGGIDMITAADMRYASADAYFGIEEINIGMTADVGTLQRLPRLIAPGIVRELAYTGRRFSAQEAREWGLVNTVYDSREALLAGVMEIARDIAEKSPLAIEGTKAAILNARDTTVAQGLDFIATWNAGMLQPTDLMTAMQARVAKQVGEFDDLLPKSQKL